MKSPQAQVAKLAKQYLQGRGIECRTRSDSFSMGDSVDVDIYDQPPEVVRAVEAELKKYQYGHFDGMTDSYESSNRRHDIPQTKFLHVNNRHSDETKQAAYAYLRANWHGGESLPELYADGKSHELDGEQAATMVHRLLCGSLNGFSVSFWEARLQNNSKPAAQPIEGARIEEHTHTKHNFQMFIVIMPRVDRAEFDRLLGATRAAGGWYSRQWGTTPGGFAFRDRATAEAFATGATPSAPTTATKAPAAPAKDNNRAQKLRDIADKMQTAIDDKFRDRQTNTPKRLAQSEHARLDGLRLQRTQKALRALADLHDAGTVPAVLSGIRTNAEVYDLMAAKTQHVANGFHSYSVETGQPHYTTPVALALWALLDGKSAEEQTAEKVRRLVQGLQFSSIPGYFPTPAAVVARMLDHAQITPGMRVLEPSAGHGAIADAVKAQGAELQLCEVNCTLAEILTAKGYAVDRGDFLEAVPSPTFDRVVMNPPFENMQDVDHVRHAFGFLKPGGRLVAIMSPSPFFNGRSKGAEFRAWLDGLVHEVYDLPAGTFKESGTGVASKLVVIEKG